VLTIAALAAGLGAARRRAAAGPVEPVPVPDACDSPPSPRRWGALVPGTLLVLLAAGRFAGGLPDHERDVADLYERASKAYGAERWEEAAEFARHALAWSGAPELTAELRCLRGESLLRGGRPREAAEEFEKVAEDKSRGAHLPEALFGLVEARTAAGDPAAANAARERLLEEYPETPWADRARTDRQGRSERPGSP
jgi:TolA-binding protein